MVVMDKKASNGARIIVRDDCLPERGSKLEAERLAQVYRVCDRILRNVAIRELEARKTHLTRAE